MQKSLEPLVVHHFLTWWLIDICSSSAILLTVHLARITIEPLQRVSDMYRLIGSDQQEDLATHAIEADLGPPNFGLTTAWRKATTRDEWRHIVDTAVLQRSTLWKKVAERMLTLRVASNLLTNSIFFVYRAVTVNEFNTTFTRNQLNSRRSCADPWEVCSDASNVGALTTDDKSMEPRRRFHHTWLYAVCLQ